MSPAETRALERLEHRLFGDDGNTGAIGLLTAEVSAGFSLMNGRVRAIEGKHIAEDAIAGERRANTERITAEKRWRLGLMLGIATSIGIGVLNGILSIVGP